MKTKVILIFTLIITLFTTTIFSAYAENSFDEVSNIFSDTSDISEDLPANSSPTENDESNPNADSIFGEESTSENDENSSIISEPNDSSSDTESFDDNSDYNDNSETSNDTSPDSSTEESSSESVGDSNDDSSSEPSYQESTDESINELPDESQNNSSYEESADITLPDESLDESSDTSIEISPPEDDSKDESEDESDISSEEISKDESNVEEDKYYSISVSQTNGGKVTINKTTAKKGETITIQITENIGYRLFSVTVNGKTITKNTFSMPEDDVEIVVKFMRSSSSETSSDDSSAPEHSLPTTSTTSKDESKTQTDSNSENKYYTIKTYTLGEGSVSVDRSSATKGTRIIVTVNAAEGYKLEYIEFNGNKITEIGEKYAFVMPAKNVSIRVSFILNESETSTEEQSNVDISDYSEDISLPSSSFPEVSEESIDNSQDESIVETSEVESTIIDILSKDESTPTDVSVTEKEPSSALMFIVPCIIALAMIGSIVTFFIRKYNNV